MPSRKRVQELIGEVARRHNALVDPGDPIFVAVTLNELVLQDHLLMVEQAIEEAQRSAEATWSRQAEAGSRAAAQLLNDGARQVTDRLHVACRGLQTQLEALVAQLVARARADALDAERSRRRSEWAAGVAAVCALIALALTAAVLLRTV